MEQLLTKEIDFLDRTIYTRKELSVKVNEAFFLTLKLLAQQKNVTVRELVESALYNYLKDVLPEELNDKLKETITTVELNETDKKVLKKFFTEK
ncbi:hypothetical protein [Saccharolobus islandicus]|uniref:Uncharacterized protein n=1 Tax=Saccharolobus islandicus (strain M.16.4 / Kamchatka \|nr:hypothetical protein [Sulfolobus islandicus]ACR41510.1 hypothetical protein M164_0898 [Sulfolobus islandicus M.16.4]